jgi:hypothetical protein
MEIAEKEDARPDGHPRKIRPGQKPLPHKMTAGKANLITDIGLAGWGRRAACT